MQITIDITKLPEGTTEEQVYETIIELMGNCIGDNERPGVGYDFEKKVLDALVEPENTGS